MRQILYVHIFARQVSLLLITSVGLPAAAVPRINTLNLRPANEFAHRVLACGHVIIVRDFSHTLLVFHVMFGNKIVHLLA